MEKVELVAQALVGIMFLLPSYTPLGKYKPSKSLRWGMGLSLLILTVGEWLVPGKVVAKGSLAFWLMCVGGCNFIPLGFTYFFQIWKYQRNQKVAKARQV